MQQSVENAMSPDDEGDADPYFVVRSYPNGLLTVAVEGSGDEGVDGETLLTWSEWGGVEMGPSTIFAAVGDPTLMLFAGAYSSQKAVFDEWSQRMRRNKRPAVYLAKGIKGLVRLGPTAKPPLPEIDAHETERANTIMRIAGERMREAAKIGDLTEASCNAIVEQVTDELETAHGPSQ